ncbi:MAG TPA: YdeI/OmpD-associated family protein [Pedobacter sp.]
MSDTENPLIQIIFLKHSISTESFLSLSKSVQKAILQWLVLAKRPETIENKRT